MLTLKWVMRDPRPDDSTEGPVMSSRHRSSARRPGPRSPPPTRCRVVDDGELVGIVDDEAILRVVVAEEGPAWARQTCHTAARRRRRADDPTQEAPVVEEEKRRSPRWAMVLGVIGVWIVIWSMSKGNNTLELPGRSTPTCTTR